MRYSIIAILLLAACGESRPKSAASRTSAQQRTADSLLGASELPGAAGVTKALTVSDSLSTRQQRIDSIAGVP